MSKVIIIAEAGVNHNGELDNAKKLIDVAAESGADYVKFQSFKTKNLVSENAATANYQKEATDVGSQFELLKKLELDESFHEELLKHCRKSGIKFLSTAFDLESLELLHSFDLDLYKIPSGEVTNLPYLRKVGSFGCQVVLSTGMCNLIEIEDAIKAISESGTSRNNMTVLHCTTEYPTPYSEVNLTAMLNIKKELQVEVGYSDHTLGIEVPIAAVALGATVIEKHFTLSREMEGPDHKASLEPIELNSMVESIRNIELAISGSGVKEPTKTELKNRELVRKSIHLVGQMKSGQMIKPDNLIMLRPGTGISPMEYDSVIGKKINKDLEASHLLTWEDLI